MRRGAIGALFCAFALAAGCEVDRHSERLHSYQVRGVVEAVSPGEGQAVVQHEEIPGLMPAMSMNFDVPNPALLEKLAPGQQIEFTLELRDRSFRITAARVLSETPAPGASGTHGVAGAPGTRGASVIHGAAGISGTHGAVGTSGTHGTHGASGLLGGVDELDLAPAFRLTDQQGRAVSLADWRGQAVLLDFIYTHCPGPCPILTARHVELQRALPPALRARVHFASISLDPQRDTPEALRAYAEARGADLSDWSFLTGPAEEISAVLRAYGIGAGRSGGGEIEHLVATFLIDPQGRITRRFLGLEHSTQTLQTALQRAAS